MSDGCSPPPHLAPPTREGYSWTMTTTQRLLDLAAAAPACHDADLLLLLGGANELYQQGFEDLHREMAERLGGPAVRT